MANRFPPPPIKYDTSSFVWLDWYNHLYRFLSTDGTIPWVNLDFTGSNLTDIQTRHHNDLQLLQGGAAGQYYHLTSTEYTGTGTGTFVRQISPTLSGPTIDGTNPYIQFNNGVAVALAAGRMWYNGTTGSWNLGMGNGNITQQVGEELFVYGKASAAITDSPLQIVYHTGTVGGSGVITFGPTVAGITNGDLIVGVATESLATNAFGRVTSFGVVHGITTTGAAYGETWADGDTIWYNPVTGNPTNVKPSAPNIKVAVGVLIKAGPGGSGSIQVEINHGSVLGGTDSNVQFGTISTSDLIQYNGTYWTNVAPSSIAIGTATNLAGGVAGSLPYQSAVNTTTFLGIGTAGQVLKVNAGATAPQWTSGAALTKTDDTNVTLTLGGTPATSLLAATSLTLGWTGQLAVARGGTGVATTSANYVFAGPNGSAGAPSFRALVSTDIPSLSYVSSVGATAPIASSGGLTPTISISQATTSTNGYLSSTDWNTFNNKQSTSAPVTYTANFSVATTDNWIINNKSGSSCTATLPAASSFSGRVLHFQNYQAQTLVSASSNVVPIAGGAATTAILSNVAGDICTLVSDGTNWIMTQYTPNNILLLE